MKIIYLLLSFLLLSSFSRNNILVKEVVFYRSQLPTIEKIIANINLIDESSSNLKIDINDVINEDNYNIYANEGRYLLIIKGYDNAKNEAILHLYINVYEDNFNKNTLILGLYNKLTDKELIDKISYILNKDKSEMFSIKHNIDYFNKGEYLLEVYFNNNEIYQFKVILKELREFNYREINFIERCTCFFTIFFNLDFRYQTKEFLDFKERINYIDEIYKTNLIKE